jgi:hypothetical protein
MDIEIRNRHFLNVCKSRAAETAEVRAAVLDTVSQLQPDGAIAGFTDVSFLRYTPGPVRLPFGALNRGRFLLRFPVFGTQNTD